MAIVKIITNCILVYKQRRFDSHSVSERLFSYSFSLLINPIFVQRNNGVSVLYRSAIFALRKGKISYGNDQAGKDVNLEVEEGEKLVIIGPSGSGKSTTVRCMNFLEMPSSGHVYIDGVELTSKNRTKMVRDSTSMVFQQFNLYPHMTVLKNLTLAPIKLHHKSRKEAEELAYHYLDIVGLKDKANVYPTTQAGC